jgi:predicted ATPase
MPPTYDRLGHREIAAMIDRVTGNKALAASVREDIVERADGIPLFVEEITKAVLEAGDQEAERAVAALPSPPIAVPATLHASLISRLDRLGSAKVTAQVGAVVGREFSYALLAAVARTPEDKLQSALERLTDAGLLLRQGIAPHATYLFKHALLQDAAYGTLLREARRALHGRIAETLESQFSEITETQPELLARHFSEAGLIEKAASYWSKAGRRSVARSALVEAVQQFTRALAQIATLPATPALRHEQIELQVALITPLIHVKGYAAPETKAATERAHRLIEQAQALGEPPDDPLLLFSVLYSFCVANYIAFNGAAMRELAAQFLNLAEREGTTVPLMIGHRIVGIALFATGDIEQGRDHSDRAFRFYDPAEHRSLGTRFGQDVGVSILTYRAFAQWVLGYPKAALADADRALGDAREIGQASTLMYALTHTTFIHLACGNYHTATSEVDQLAASAGEKASPFWTALGTLLEGYLCALTGDASNAVRLITSGLAVLRSTGSRLLAPFFLAYLAYSHVRLGQLDDAWRCIGDAVSEVEGTGERWYEPELQRIAGTIALKQAEPDAAKAQGYFERALTVARQQQAKSWELRAAMSMARLWRDQGKRNEARELLAPVYGWFTEGFDTRDLKEAKKLLDELVA